MKKSIKITVLIIGIAVIAVALYFTVLGGT